MRITKSVDRWFDIPDDPDGARLLIHNLLPQELDEINDKAFVQDINYKKVKGKKEKFEPTFTSKTDKKAFRELPIQKAVVGWENFFDEDDKPLEYSPENVLKAARTIDGFAELVSELREQLSKDIAQEKDDQRKN